MLARRGTDCHLDDCSGEHQHGDTGLGSYLRLISTNGVITFAPNNATTNTSSTIRLAFNSAGTSTPYLLAVGSDNGSFQTISFGFGSSFVAGARQLSFGTTLTNYTAGTERLRLTSTGMRIQPGGVSANPSASSAFEIVSTNSFFTPPIMTSAERDAVVPKDGDILFNSTTSKLQVRAGGAWVDLH